MSDKDEVRRSLEVASAVLLRCLIVGAGLLVFWFVILLLAGDMAHGVHSKFYDITKQQFDVIHYCGMGLTKLIVFVAFVIPYVAIRLTLRSASQAGSSDPT